MKRKALFVGVNEYRDPVIQDLRYAENDAALLFAQFKAIGYDAVLMSSPTRSEVENKVAKMIEHMDGEDDVFLFYFAGHGFVAPGDDERLFCKDDFYHKLQYHSAGLSFAMLRDTTRQGGLNRIFILDACRSNAFAGQRGGGRPRDLVPMSKMMGESAVRDVRCHGGHAIWRSCSSGQCAMELEPYEHGVFSLAIDMVMSECLRAGRELEFDKPFMRLVVNKMQEISQGEQMPEDQYSGNWPGIVLIQGSGSSTYSQNFARITSQPIVVCPVCGRHNQIADSFRCRVCGRDYLCERHYDEANNCCTDCASKWNKAHEDGERKSREEVKHKTNESIGPSIKIDGGATEFDEMIRKPMPGAPVDFGDFLLKKELGLGSMGGVFLAYDKKVGCNVAIKVMTKELGSDPVFVGRFKRMMRVVAQLNHPNIAHVYSFGLEHGLPFIAMELLQGGSLDTDIEAASPGMLDQVRTMHIGQQLVDALAFAAESGIMHGDVKPANVLYTDDGTIKLVDFGLGEMMKGDSDEIWGTPYYISPEKVRRQKIDFRADIYSLGGTLYHAFTGRPPFDGEDVREVVVARFRGMPPRPRSVRPDLAPEIDEIIMHMLEPTPAKRYRTYWILREDITRFLTKAGCAVSKMSPCR